MLPQDKTITTPRLLCKFVTGRTSASPVTSINHYLAKFKDSYRVAITNTKKKGPALPATATLEIEHPETLAGGGANKKTIVFPFSPREFIVAVLTLDSNAEQALGLAYGRGTGAAER